MNYFNRHLNWTMVLAWLVGAILVYASILAIATILSTWSMAVVTYSLFGWISNEVIAQSLYWFLGLITIVFAFAVVVMSWWITIWAIKKKGRSQWNLGWLLIPFGFIALLALKNRA